MKGIKIEIEEKDKPMYLYRSFDVVDAIAYAIYYTANPDSEMCVPNCAFEKAEKMFAEWRDDTRLKKAVATITGKSDKWDSEHRFYAWQSISEIPLNKWHIDESENGSYPKCNVIKWFKTKEDVEYYLKNFNIGNEKQEG